MRNIYGKIFIVLIISVIFSCNVYATNENTENTVNNENTISEEKIDEKPTEVKKNEKMYVQERCNIRSSYSADSERVGGLDVGTEVTVVSEYSNGWYKIKYDGGEAYIKAGILRSTKPEIPEPESEDNTKQNSDTNQTENIEQGQTENIITETTTENNDEVLVEDAEIINEIGVLPEVGKNIADYLYICSIVLVIGALVYIKIRL